MPYHGVGKALHDHSKTQKVKRHKHCYFWNKVHLLIRSQDWHFFFRQSLCNYVAHDHSLMHLLSPVYKNGSNYIDKMKFRSNIWGNEVMIFATTDMASKGVVMYK